MPSSHLILCHPFLLLLQSLPPSESFPMSQLFTWGGQSTGVSALASFPPKKSQGWSPSEWTDLLAVQGTLKSLLQHHSSKASILQLSAFFTVQLSHPYMTTGKTIALTRRTLVSKVMSLFLNILSRLVTQKSSSLSSKTGRKKYKRQKKETKEVGRELCPGKRVLKREKFPNTRKHSHCQVCGEPWKHRGQHNREENN